MLRLSECEVDDHPAFSPPCAFEPGDHPVPGYKTVPRLSSLLSCWCREFSSFYRPKVIQQDAWPRVGVVDEAYS